MWSCQCECGSSVNVKSQLLMRGITKSCGCLQRDLASSRRIVDHSGRRFGMLTALSMDSRGGGYGHAYAHWLCRCDCGKEKVVRSNCLVNGDTASCGCWKDTDLAGRRFGKLTAVTDLGYMRDRKSRMWACSCDCGGERKTRSGDLRAGKVISCGCAALDAQSYMPIEARRKGLEAVSRRRAFKKNAGGSFTEDQIIELHIKQRGCCANCKVKLGDKFHRDHKIALSLGGTNDITNIELLCAPCNLSKHAKDSIIWANENGRLL